MPQDHLATPLQHPVTTQDPLGTTWHHQIAWGTTWEPYKAKTMAKKAAPIASPASWAPSIDARGSGTS